MATLRMCGPYALHANLIDALVGQTSPGNYALGHTDDAGAFRVWFVGRSDSDLNARVHQHLGRCDQFKFSYATSPKAAFDKECKNYHDFNPPGNNGHPATPEGTNWTCPRCQVFAQHLLDS
jgi:hypothetical protein